MATSSELLFRDLLNEPMHFCLARLVPLKKQTLYYLIIKHGGVITGARVDASSRTIILVEDSETFFSNYIGGVPTFKASYINECIRAKCILDISQFVMSNVFIADENLNYMDVVYERKCEWTTLLPSIKALKIEIQSSRFHEDSSSPSIPTIQFEPASTSLAQGDTSIISAPITEAEIMTLVHTFMDEISHPCQFQCGVQAATAQNLRQHYLEVHGADFYSACCFCSAKCFSNQDFRMHIEHCRYRKLEDHNEDQYWNEVEKLRYSEQYSKLAFDFLKLLLCKPKKKRVVLLPRHMDEIVTEPEHIWRLGHCTLAKWAETDPNIYDAAFLKLNEGELIFAVSLIPDAIFSREFKKAMIERYFGTKCPENLSRKILQPCYPPEDGCAHPYSAVYWNDESSETASDTNGNSLETVQNVGIEPDRTNENPESIPEPSSSKSVPEPNSSKSIPEPNSSESISEPNSSESISEPNSSESISEPNSSESISEPNSSENVPEPMTM